MKNRKHRLQPQQGASNNLKRTEVLRKLVVLNRKNGKEAAGLVSSTTARFGKEEMTRNRNSRPEPQ